MADLYKIEIKLRVFLIRRLKKLVKLLDRHIDYQVQRAGKYESSPRYKSEPTAIKNFQLWYMRRCVSIVHLIDKCMNYLYGFK